MPTSEPLHVAFVWHMHQPYYRSALTGSFEMPWARLHALKDYLDMVDTVSRYPELRQTFNLVPSLVEQLEDYARGDFVDVYWEHSLKPAAELTAAECTFVVERLCELSGHPRTRAHPRYLELAVKREAHASLGWEACSRLFSIDELRDLQIWSNLAWFDPDALETGPLSDLVAKGGHFSEEDKLAIAKTQTDILERTLPAYRAAAHAGRVELTTSPYFHPILPLLADSDLARIAASDTLLPPRRFAHPEDAAEHIRSAVEKHQTVFGEHPRGMWCSEQAVGETVIPLLIAAGLQWTISDETVLACSLSGAAGAGPRMLDARSLYTSYRLEREGGEIAMVFRDHTLSDLIGFEYRSWDSRDAAADLIRRLHEIRATLRSLGPTRPTGLFRALLAERTPPLVTIALDGENAWEYYPRDGRDFLHYLYEGLSADPALRCVSVSEHLADSPAVRPLSWLHTGSWIGGDLRTWSGDTAHNAAWDLLHRARDLAASRRRSLGSEPNRPGDQICAEAAWRHIMIAEGSDWFWWFGDHHHTELDHMWDLHFRLHLQEVYRRLGEDAPVELSLPLLQEASASRAKAPSGRISPTIDGVITTSLEWDAAGALIATLPSTMHRAETTRIDAVRFGWDAGSLCVLVVPAQAETLEGLEVQVTVTGLGGEMGWAFQMALEPQGRIEVSFSQSVHVPEVVTAWKDVLEVRCPLDGRAVPAGRPAGLVVGVGRGGVVEQVFHSAGLDSLGWEAT